MVFRVLDIPAITPEVEATASSSSSKWPRAHKEWAYSTSKVAHRTHHSHPSRAMASPAWSICARPPPRYVAPSPRSYVFTLLHEDHSPIWRRWAECLGLNVMPRQHELARARSTSQLEPSQLQPRHKRARARNQARPTLRSPCAALRSSPSPQDGRWRPCRIERKFSPVHTRRQREQQPSCTPRGTTALLIKPQFAPHGSL